MAGEYVLTMFYRMINQIKSQLNQAQTDELDEDYNYDDMEPIKEYFYHRIGSDAVSEETLCNFVDDIIENIEGIHANPNNPNTDDMMELLADSSKVMYKSMYIEQKDVDLFLNDPFHGDYATSVNSRNSFKLLNAWKKVFAYQTESQKANAYDVDAYANWCIAEYKNNSNLEVEQKRVLMEIIDSLHYNNESIRSNICDLSFFEIENREDDYCFMLMLRIISKCHQTKL